MKSFDSSEPCRTCLLNGQSAAVACHCDNCTEPLSQAAVVIDAEAQLFQEGDVLVGVQCICIGRVLLLKRHVDGRMGVVGVALPGDLLGYPDLLVGDSYLNTAIAVEKSTLYFLPRECFVELMQNDPLIMLRLMTRLSQRVMDVEERLTTLDVRHDTDERLMNGKERASK